MIIKRRENDEDYKAYLEQEAIKAEQAQKEKDAKAIEGKKDETKDE